MELVFFILFAIASVVTWIWCFVIGFRTNVIWGVLIVLFHPIATIVYSISYWYVVKKALLASLVALAGLVWLGYLNGGGETGAMAPTVQTGNTQPSEIETTRQAGTAIMQQMEKMHTAGLISDEEIAQLRAEYEEQMTLYEQQAKQQVESAARTASPKQAAPQTSLAPPSTESPRSPAPPPIPAETGKKTTATANLATANPTELKAAKLVPKDQAHKFIGHEIIVTEIDGRERSGILADVRDRSLVVERRQRSGAMKFLISISNVKAIKVK